MKMRSSIPILYITTALAVSAEYFGVPLGELKDSAGRVIANVWIANSTVIQLTDANVPKDSEHSFGFTNENDFKSVDLYVVNGNGRRAYSEKVENSNDLGNYARIFVRVPQQISNWKNFGLYSLKTKSPVAEISLNANAPEPLCCLSSKKNSIKGIIGKHYNVSTKPITIIDSRTFLIPGLAFEGTRAPDGWVFGGNGEVNQETGHKLQVVGRDEYTHCALHEHYDGSTDIVARLPAPLTVYDIDYLAMFCYQYDVDFGHVNFKLNPEDNPLPAYIPPLSHGPIPVPSKCD